MGIPIPASGIPYPQLRVPKPLAVILHVCKSKINFGIIAIL